MAEPQPARAEPVRSVVIVGGGTAGWMSAAALAKLLGPRLFIRLVESDAIGTIGVGEATIPAIKIFNQALEIHENDFVAATQGTFKLGIQFDGWSRPGVRYMHGFGRIGQNLGWLRTHQYWLKARALGQASDFSVYSINTAAALRNRFMPARPELASSPLREIAYAYHFDASLYAKFLRRYAEARGVVRTEGKVVGTELRSENGFLDAIVLESGERITADLFIDCSGLVGLLIEKALGVGYEDWSRFLPCNRALAAPCASVTPLTPYTRATARSAGWQWRIPLQHRIGNGYVYCSDFISDDDAKAELLGNLDAAPMADPRPIKFVTGKRKQLWSRNVVAVGLSGGFLEPLESTSIHLTQTAILRLVGLFPDKAFRESDIAEFNAQVDLEYERVRDFLVAHYRIGQREDTPFWKHCRTLPIPDALARKMANFAGAGRVFKDGEELFDVESWIQVFIGQDFIPASWDPAVELRSDAEILSYLKNIEAVNAQCVEVIPDHADYIRRTCSAAQAATQ
ncbi:MAG: tryptophan halogenase family protein [Pseudomonadota bacterium]